MNVQCVLMKCNNDISSIHYNIIIISRLGQAHNKLITGCTQYINITYKSITLYTQARQWLAYNKTSLTNIATQCMRAALQGFSCVVLSLNTGSSWGTQLLVTCVVKHALGTPQLRAAVQAMKWTSSGSMWAADVLRSSGGEGEGEGLGGCGPCVKEWGSEGLERSCPHLCGLQWYWLHASLQELVQQSVLYRKDTRSGEMWQEVGGVGMDGEPWKTGACALGHNWSQHHTCISLALQHQWEGERTTCAWTVMCGRQLQGDSYSKLACVRR